MSRRVRKSGGAQKWMMFCRHLREDIIDEQKAPVNYGKRIKEAEELMRAGLITEDVNRDIWDTLSGIIGQEQEHKKKLMPIFDEFCPRMAVHRKGIKHHRRQAEWHEFP